MAIVIASTFDRRLWTHRTWDHLCGIGKLVRIDIRAGYRYQLEIKHEPRENKQQVPQKSAWPHAD
jgi:phosphoribosyl 1,2-cyclic phosphodiesterase